MKNIFLVGFMGCGKSTVSRYMSEQYGFDLVELDEEIASMEHMPISQIFEEKGEEYFRNLESQALYAIQKECGKIVSCGGGIILREQNVLEMKKRGIVVWLTASPETILTRVLNDNNRPLLQGKKSIDDIKHMLEQREAKYKEASSVMIQTDQKAVSDICKEILEQIKE